MTISKRRGLLLLAALGAAAVLAAVLLLLCTGSRMVFASEFKDGTVFEYGTEQLLPRAYVVNRLGIRQKNAAVTYTFTNETDTVLESAYPVAPCDSVGQWTVRCTAGSAEATRSFTVADTVAPQIEIGAVPYDVFLDETDKEYSIPAVNFVDASPIDYQKSYIKLLFEGTETSYNQMTGAFVPERAGRYELQIHAEDKYGNAADAACTWRAKDRHWQDSRLPADYLSSFDDEGYVNLVSSGFINQWWTGAVSEEYQPEYGGETGVLRITMDYSPSGYAVAKVYLARPIRIQELGDRKIVIRFRVDDEATNGRLTLAGNYVEAQSSSVARYFDLEPGQWTTAVIDAAALREVHYADDDGVLRSLQFGLTRQSSQKSSDIYLASVTVATPLSTPTGVTAQDGTLRWTAVEGAVGYRVTVDGKEHTLAAGTTSLAGTGTVHKVRALGNGLTTLDSDDAVYVHAAVPAGYLSENDQPYYTELVWNNGDGVQGGMTWYEADSFAASFDAAQKAVRLDMQFGYVCAGAVMQFPRPVKTAELDTLVVRVHLDSAVRAVKLYGYGSDGTLGTYTDLQAGWNTLTVSRAALTAAYREETLAGLQLAFYSSAELRQGYRQGEPVTVLLGAVTNARPLAAPQALTLTGDRLTWNAVSGAVGYRVDEDGRQTVVKTPAYTVTGGKLLRVTALGDGITGWDSEMAVYVNAHAAPGYLSGNDADYYRYLVWNNGAEAPGGMPWYNSDAFAVRYNSAETCLDLTLTHGYVCAGVVLRFPQPAALAGVESVQVRVKLDGSVSRVLLFPYGGSDTQVLGKYTELQPGWNTLTIPKASLRGADGGDTLMGLQLAFYGSPEGTAFGTDQGRTMSVSLGAVTAVARKVQLAAPAGVRYEDGTLYWEPVEGATGYRILSDGQELFAAAGDTRYSGLTGEVVEIRALGNGADLADSEPVRCVAVVNTGTALADNDRAAFTYLIYNNGKDAPGGMEWYESDGFNAVYDAERGGIRLELIQGYVCAGVVERFAQSAAVAQLPDVLVRLWLDDTVRAVKLYPYGSSATLLFATELHSGWNELVIPHEALVAALGAEGSLSGLQLALYTTEALTPGVGQGTAITACLGTIRPLRRLTAPVVTLSGDTLSWSPVPGASGYEVYVDGTCFPVGTACVIDLSELGTGVFRVTVRAVSDDPDVLPGVSNEVVYSSLETLPTPQVVYDDRKLRLSAARLPGSYTVCINGVEYIVACTGAQTTVDITALTGLPPDRLILYRVKANGDNETTADSAYTALQAQDMELQPGTLADFDAGYTALVHNNGKDTPGGMEWYESDSFAAAYDETEQAVRLDMTYGYVCAGAVVEFPESVSVAQLETVTLRIRLDASVKRVVLYPYGGSGKLGVFTELHSGWNELTVSREALEAALGADGCLSGLQLAIFGNENGDMGVNTGSPVTVWLGEVSYIAR